MEKLFGNKLAVVEFDFLERVGTVEEWDSRFFELFKWIDDVEKNHEQSVDLHFMLFNDQVIFYKERNRERIGIYENQLPITPPKKKQLLTVCFNQTKMDQERTEIFTANLLTFLQEAKIKNHVLMEKNFGKLQKPFVIQEAVVVSFGFEDVA